MRLDRVNQWLTLLGNIGVIAGIIFLAIEIQNNTHATQAQTRDSVAEKLMTWQLAISTNEFTADAFAKGWTGDEMSVAELHAYNQLVQSSFRMWENEWYQYQMGLYSEEEFLPRLARIESTMSMCSFRKVWKDGALYSPSFRNLVNGMIEESTNSECN